MARWDAEYLASMRLEMDPLADRCVKALFESAGLGVVSTFQGRLVDAQGMPRSGLPQPMVEFLQETAQRPSWTDPEKLRLGESVLSSHGVLVLLICGCASLPECYVDRLGMPVLFLTQKLNRDINRRIAETILFVKNVLSADGFSPTGAGLDSARKVRLMHAAVRYLILQSDPDKLAAGLPPDVAGAFRTHTWKKTLGLPINQEDLAYTLQTFSWVMIRGMRSFSVGLTAEEEEAIHHCWNVAGQALGIREELLPKNVSEAEELFELIKARVEGSSEEGRSMTAAVMDFAKARIPLHHYEVAPQVLSRYLVGTRSADMLGLPPLTLHQRFDQWRWVLEISAIAHLRERRLERLPFMRGWSVRLFQFLLGRRLARSMTEVPFQIPKALADHWSLNKMQSGAAG